jgi:hypothetical protein
MNDGQFVLFLWLLGLNDNPDIRVGQIGLTANKYVEEKSQDEASQAAARPIKSATPTSTASAPA